VTEHDRWLGYLADKYNRPRAELAKTLSGKLDLEYEIAVLISESALSKARALIQDREWADDSSTDLYDRAVYGHWRRLRDLEITKNAGAVAEMKTLLNEG
jgi:hypothetical protein